MDSKRVKTPFGDGRFESGPTKAPPFRGRVLRLVRRVRGHGGAPRRMCTSKRPDFRGLLSLLITNVNYLCSLSRFSRLRKDPCLQFRSINLSKYINPVDVRGVLHLDYNADVNNVQDAEIANGWICSGSQTSREFLILSLGKGIFESTTG